MEKRKVLITGASRGMGWDVALELANKGHSILVTARNEERLRELAKQAGDQCEALPLDLTHADQTPLREAINRLGGVDTIINNAGALISKPFEELADPEWQSLFEVNFFGVVRLLRSCLPFLEQSPNAHVLNISSMGGYQGSSKFPGLSAYSASKGALSILSECLAEEWKEKGIRVNCLALGAVQTEMLEEAFPGLKAPLQSAEMAEFISWFALSGHRFFNGKVLPVSVSTP